MEESENHDSYQNTNYSRQTTSATPLGLEAVYNACKELYPNQPNPLQVTALVKHW